MNTTTGRPSTIRLKCKGRYEEARAAVATMPGHLVELTNTNAVKPHATAEGLAEKAVATETTNALQGKGIDTVYAIGDLVSYVLCHPGDEMLMWLKDGETVVPGDKLVSAGDGTLQKLGATEVAASGNAETLTIPANAVVAVARETLDLTGVGNTTAQLLKVRIF